MANFRAEIKGAKGPSSRLGHSYILADVNGWDIGIRVEGNRFIEGKRKFNRFDVFLTGGSNGGKPVKPLLSITEDH